MAHFVTSGDEYRDLRDSLSGYRFGRTHGKRIRGRAALNRIGGYLKNAIEAIANSKVRRMERELELRGIRFDGPNNSWGPRKPGRTSARED
jgi:hypothetical protein